MADTERRLAFQHACHMNINQYYRAIRCSFSRDQQATPNDPLRSQGCRHEYRHSAGRYSLVKPCHCIEGHSPATKPTSQPRSSAKAHLQALSPAERNLLRKAAQGDAEAQDNLGAMYANSQGVPQDHTKAAYWFRKAVAQGGADAQCNLRVMYAKGQGVPQDYIQAAKWSILAKTGDNKDANKLPSLLESKMTPTQIAEAQRLATQWWKTHH